MQAHGKHPFQHQHKANHIPWLLPSLRAPSLTPPPPLLQTSTAALQMPLQEIVSGLNVLRNDRSNADSSGDVRRTPARTRQCRIAVHVTSPLFKSTFLVIIVMAFVDVGGGGDGDGGVVVALLSCFVQFLSLIQLMTFSTSLSQGRHRFAHLRQILRSIRFFACNTVSSLCRQCHL